jgi:hypothetical protein
VIKKPDWGLTLQWKLQNKQTDGGEAATSGNEKQEAAKREIEAKELWKAEKKKEASKKKRKEAAKKSQEEASKADDIEEIKSKLENDRAILARLQQKIEKAENDDMMIELLEERIQKKQRGEN